MTSHLMSFQCLYVCAMMHVCAYVSTHVSIVRACDDAGADDRS
jgi:hypothetical protein